MNANPFRGGEEAGWHKQILEIEERHRRAFLEQDVETLQGLWDDGLLVNSPLNRIDGKQRLLGLLAQGVISHTALEVHIETVTRVGDSVVVMGHEMVTNGEGSQPFGRRFTNVWCAAGGSWRLAARHANVVA